MGGLLSLFLVVIWIAMGAIAGDFLERHKKFGTGFFYGLLFGPFGMILAFLRGDSLDRQAERAKDRELADHRHRELMRVMSGDPSPSEPPPPPRPPTVEEINAREPARQRRWR